MDESREIPSVTRTTHDAEPRTVQPARKSLAQQEIIVGTTTPIGAADPPRWRYSPRTDRMNRPATRYGSSQGGGHARTGRLVHHTFMRFRRNDHGER